MQPDATRGESPSPFHAGEQEIQTRTGKREAMEAFGRKIIRPFMPDEHRVFFNQLPYIVVGSVDSGGWPWASIIPGNPGFIESPDRKRLDINATPLAGDPLHDSWKKDAPIGLLGIELATRRRNRLNASVRAADGEGLSLTVDQSFGNCPQYIQTRPLNFVRDPAVHSPNALAEPIESLAGEAQAAIEMADTFFVASYLPTQARREVEGVDVSHRGGRAGFVKVEGNTLTVPDYSGNYHFNTLGNFLLNPKAGLLFPNFETGDVLMLTGTVELVWEDDPEIAAFRGAERGWRVTMERGVWLRDALPFRAELGEFSPNSLMAGDWAETAATLELHAQRNAWRPFRVARIEKESSVIRSFYLEPADGKPCLPFEAGQFLTLRITPDGAAAPSIRTYTVSSAPTDPQYRISIKQEPDGLVSNLLHEKIAVGDTLEIKAPSGDFTLDPSVARPAVLLAGGVGITPMMSMARHVVKEGLRTRQFRRVTVFHAAQTTERRAFRDAFRHMEVQSNGAISYFSMITRPAADEKPGVDFNGAGYITADILRQVLPLDDYDFYLCGPPSFMQALYDVLRSLGVRDARILAEAFGPASLTRQSDEGAPQKTVVEEAESAVVKFTESGFEQRWNAGDATLLETAEAHGLSPNFGCRNGVCGSCATKVKTGSVAYRSAPSADHAVDEALICCAVPAKGTDVLELAL